MAIREGIHRDIAGEEKAIKDYSQRIKQAKGTGATPVLKHIRGEEREHKGELSKVLSGLKAAHK